jgi:hypothetical protein
MIIRTLYPSSLHTGQRLAVPVGRGMEEEELGGGGGGVLAHFLSREKEERAWPIRLISPGVRKLLLSHLTNEAEG